MIDAVNVVDIVVYQYWDNKIRGVSGIIKNEWESVMKSKEKRKRTRWDMPSYRHLNWSTVEL